jgi:hypothetical protein
MIIIRGSGLRDPGLIPGIPPKLDVVQLVERLTVNQKVAGSSPAVEIQDILYISKNALLV